MIEFKSNGGRLLENGVDELPKLSGNIAFLDLETTSFDSTKKSTNPWHDCWVLGVAVRVDDGPAYYVPVNHAYKQASNYSQEEVQVWLINVLSSCEVWVNHNIKYDMQVLHNSLGIQHAIKKYCTLDLAKMIDSDRMSFSLDALSHDWLYEDISKYEHAFTPYLKDNKDYGLIPMDLMAEYACQDVITESRLWKYIVENMPEESLTLMETSSALIECLADIEHNGMRVDPEALVREELIALNEMCNIQSEIFELTGLHIEPHTAAGCQELLCNYYGFPIVEWSDSTPPKPSFDKEALEKYRALPNVRQEHNEMIDRLLRYRRLQSFTSVFTKQYRILHVNGYLHGFFNPTVRTGRMSMSKPNMQQLMEEARKLIIPDDDDDDQYGYIIACDYSSIEYRTISHYCANPKVIAAYAADPWMDYHAFVAELCTVTRKPAKTLNFLMGYGGGKKRLVQGLMQIPELMAAIIDELNQADELSAADREHLFKLKGTALAEGIFNIYHRELPELRQVSKQAMNRIYERGYVVNKYGRRRHLPVKAAYRAFNTVCQGTAADMMKERLVALWKWLAVEFPFVKLIGVVHDEVVLRARRCDMCDYLLDAICFILEDISVELRVPIRTSIGYSDINWYEASENDNERKFDRVAFRSEIQGYIT